MGITPTIPSTAPATNNTGNPVLPQNWDCRHTTIEYIIIVVLTSMGMGPLEQSMKDIIDEQNIQNKVDSDLIQFSSLISEIEAASKETGVDPAKLTGLQAKLKTLLTNMFGAGTTMKDGKFVDIDPNSKSFENSDVGKFEEMLRKKNTPKGQDPDDPKNPYNPDNDPVFDLIKDVGSYLFNTIVSGTVSGIPDTCSSSIWNTIMNGKDTDFTKMINLMAGNYWLKQNPGKNVTGGEDYLSTFYNKLSGGQSALQGMGSQNTAMIQTDSSSENSLDQTGQNILNAAKDLKTFMIQQLKG